MLTFGTANYRVKSIGEVNMNLCPAIPSANAFYFQLLKLMAAATVWRTKKNNVPTIQL